MFIKSKSQVKQLSTYKRTEPDSSNYSLSSRPGILKLSMDFGSQIGVSRAVKSSLVQIWFTCFTMIEMFKWKKLFLGFLWFLDRPESIFSGVLFEKFPSSHVATYDLEIWKRVTFKSFEKLHNLTHTWLCNMSKPQQTRLKGSICWEKSSYFRYEIPVR